MRLKIYISLILFLLISFSEAYCSTSLLVINLKNDDVKEYQIANIKELNILSVDDSWNMVIDMNNSSKDTLLCSNIEKMSFNTDIGFSSRMLIKKTGSSTDTLDLNQINTIAFNNLSSVENYTGLLSEIICYPNPFVTDIDFQVTILQAGPVDIEIYDQTGERVSSIARDLYLPQGRHNFSWQPKSSMGESLSPGVYTLRIVSQHRVISTKILLLK